MVESPLELSEEQVLYFRARRMHLAGPGALTAAQAAKALLGAQSQQLASGLLALSQRTAGRPAAKALEEDLFGARPSIVRTWGQRDTVHIYDNDTWPQVIAAKAQWAPPSGRRELMPSEELVATVHAMVLESEAPLTRSDVLPVVPKDYVDAAIEKFGGNEKGGKRMAAARPLWVLAYAGDCSIGPKRGAEQSYPARARSHPHLVWIKPQAEAAATELARRYLSTYGPASHADLGHFFGARIATVRHWLGILQSKLIEVRVEGHRDLLALAEDHDALLVEPPAQWPLRLLPLWDEMLMAHADKSWTVPVDSERKAIWRKAAMVAATVVDRGRIIATWTYKKRSKYLAVEIQPLSGWRSTHLEQTQLEANQIASHLDLGEARLTF